MPEERRLRDPNDINDLFIFPHPIHDIYISDSIDPIYPQLAPVRVHFKHLPKLGYVRIEDDLTRKI